MYINQEFQLSGQLVNGVHSFRGVADPQVWICYTPGDGKWRMQHEPDRGTGKAYAYTDGTDPSGCKQWGVWAHGNWAVQVLTGAPLAERPEALAVADRCFERTVKLLRNTAALEGVLAASLLLQVAFNKLIDPLLLPHIQSQRVPAMAATKLSRVVEALPQSWLGPGPATSSPVDVLRRLCRQLGAAGAGPAVASALRKLGATST